jgi:methyl-accepting chemotaxis protein
MALGKNFGDGNNNSNKKTDKKIMEEKEKETSEFLESTYNNNSINDIQSADIIDRLEKELANLTNERKVDLVRNNVVDVACIVSMTDRKGYITYVNDLFCSSSGYSREECIGQNQNMVRHPNMPKSVFKDLWSTVGRGNVWRGAVENLCKEGSSYHVDALISPIIGDDGKPEVYIGIRYENTGQVIAMQEASAIKTAVDTGWLSIEFEPGGKVLSANENFINTLGYGSEAEVVGHHHRMFCDDAYTNSPAYKEFWIDLANGTSQAGEFKLIRKDGTDVWINASYTPIKNAQGKIYKVIKIAANISNVKLQVL